MERLLWKQLKNKKTKSVGLTTTEEIAVICQRVLYNTNTLYIQRSFHTVSYYFFFDHDILNSIRIIMGNFE